MQTMRKELTAVSAFSMLISFVAAIVLCIHLALNNAMLTWQPGGSVLWVLEVAVFGTAVYLWRRDATLPSWVIGIAGLIVARTGLTMFCAFALTKYQPGLVFARAVEQLSALGPRTCAIFFAMMICYPLRAAIPTTLGRSKSSGSAPEEVVPETPGMFLLKNTVEQPAKPTAAKAVEDWVAAAPVVPGKFGGSVEVPLRAVVGRVPEGLVASEAQQYPGDFPVSIPLFLIGPQLREARIHLRLADLRDLLPPQVLVESASTGSEGEPVVVSLALEDVIPALPAEVLELPPPSPPAWAGYPDPDGLTFATQ